MLSGNDAPYDYAWLLGEAVAAFSSHSLPYCLIGAVALGAHGRPSATQDLDLQILADRMGSDAYLNPLLTRGFAISSEWQDSNPMAREVVLRLNHPSAPDFPLDLIFATSELHHTTLKRRQPQSRGRIHVSVSSL